MRRLPVALLCGVCCTSSLLAHPDFGAVGADAASPWIRHRQLHIVEYAEPGYFAKHPDKSEEIYLKLIDEAEDKLFMWGLAGAIKTRSDRLAEQIDTRLRSKTLDALHRIPAFNALLDMATPAAFELLLGHVYDPVSTDSEALAAARLMRFPDVDLPAQLRRRYEQVKPSDAETLSRHLKVMGLTQCTACVPILLDRLNDGSEEQSVRVAAIFALAQIGDSQSVNALAEAAEESKMARLQRHIYLALANVDHPTAAAVLLKGCRESRYKPLAAQALSQMTLSTASQALTQLWRSSSDPVVKRALASALINTADPKTIATLVEIYRLHDDKVKRALLDALEEMEYEAAQGAMATLLAEETEWSLVRRMTQIVEKRRFKAAAPSLLKHLASAEQSAQTVFLDALASIGSAEGARKLSQLYANTDIRYENREILLKALEQLELMGPGQALDLLKRLAASGQWELSGAALEILQYQGAPGLSQWIVEQELTKHRDARIRWAAARALGELRQEAGIAALGFALRDPVARVRWTAAYSLGLIKDPRAQLALKDALGDPNPVVVQYARRSLGSE